MHFTLLHAVTELSMEAVNPLSGGRVPVYVLSPWPHGESVDCVMAVPSLNECDKQFAERNELKFRHILDGDLLTQSEQVTL